MTDSTAAARSALRAAQAWTLAGRRPMCYVGQSSLSGAQTPAKAGKRQLTIASKSLALTLAPSAATPIQSQRQRHRLASTQAGMSAADNPFPLPTSSLATPYDVFHLSRTASKSEIKSRYYDLVKIYHPDRVSARIKIQAGESEDSNDNDEGQPSAASSDASDATLQKAHDDFKRIRDAYTLLSDDGRRQTYDKSGWGWDPSGNNDVGMQGSGAPPAWTGGFPRTPGEWASYEAWSASMRRGGGPGPMHRRQGWEYRGGPGGKWSGYASGRGHDRHGWQHFAGNNHNIGADWFYGYGHSHRDGNASREPLYMANHRFFLGVTIFTAVLGIGQYARIKEEASFVSSAAEQRHQSAVKSLNAARKFARSDSAKLRREEWRRKRAELRGGNGNDMDEELLSIPPPGPPYSTRDLPVPSPESRAQAQSIGHGGPSGKEAHDERLRRAHVGRE